MFDLLKEVEEASRPICFETIDLILRNKDAEKMISSLNGQQVDDEFRKKILFQLESFLATLEKLAQFWKLIDVDKYSHRKKNYGIYNKDVTTMIPYKTAGGVPIFAS